MIKLYKTENSFVKESKSYKTGYLYWDMWDGCWIPAHKRLINRLSRLGSLKLIGNNYRQK